MKVSVLKDENCFRQKSTEERIGKYGSQRTVVGGNQERFVKTAALR